jgi:hypothetical protein
LLLFVRERKGETLTLNGKCVSERTNGIT